MQIQATNELCTSSEFWDFRVTSPPQILQKLDKETIVDEKADIELSVKVDAYPPPTVKWFKDGKEISQNDPRIKLKVDGNNYTLKIHGANRDDTALYTVEFTNDNGTIRDESRIHVKTAPKFKSSLSDITVNEGDKNVELLVTLDGYPRPTIKWYCEGIEITETEYKMVEEGEEYKLIIKEAKVELRGKYTCKVTNEHGIVENTSNVTINC